MKTIFAQSSATPAEREFSLWVTFTDPKVRLPMKTRLLTAKDEPTDAEIQHAAYLLWVEDGRPEGRDLRHWLEAKALLTRHRGHDARPRERAPELVRRIRR